jgi:aerobic carbon-monoxide dehydrogenase medium subunit
MRYEAPETMKSAVSMLAREKGLAFVLAGGTDLLVKMKGGYLEPDLVVDIKKIKGVYEIKKSATGFRIGAAVPGVALSENAALKKAWPGVVEGANLIGSKQIQGRCTLAGNLCTGSPAADGCKGEDCSVRPQGKAHNSCGPSAPLAWQKCSQEGRNH